MWDTRGWRQIWEQKSCLYAVGVEVSKVLYIKHSSTRGVCAGVRDTSDKMYVYTQQMYICTTCL